MGTNAQADSHRVGCIGCEMSATNKNFLSVSIEGGDSTGKGTQTALLKDALENAGLKTKAVEVPVKSLITWHLIYFMLRNKLASKFPRFFHFVQFVNKQWWQTFTLPWIMMKYDAIVFDRWHGSYWVYGRETGLRADDKLMKLYWLHFRPTCTVVLKGARHALEERDEYEKDHSLQSRVNTRYVEWAAENHETVSIVHANQTTPAVHRDIINVLYDRGLLNKDDK